MTTYEDSLLAARFAALAPQPLTGDWDEVLGRAGAARKGRRGLTRSRALQGRRRRLLVVLAAVALVAVGTAAAFGIRAFILDRGFIGLPPQGAAQSTPESGELVLSSWGRPTSLGTISAPSFSGPPMHRAWVYADGRLIWDREGDHPFGGSERTTGFLEQRLTPEGVELLRTEVISTGLFRHDLALVSGTGIHWGGINVRNGDRLVEVIWATPSTLGWQDDSARFRAATPEEARALERLNARLTDPASWLPASAWEDLEIRAYVPSRVAVCASGYDPSIAPWNEPPQVDSSEIFALLPGPARDLLRAKGRRIADDDFCVYEVTTEEARAIAVALDVAGLERDDPEVWQAYTIDTPEAIRKQGWNQGLVAFLTILPHGEVICSHCG